LRFRFSLERVPHAPAGGTLAWDELSEDLQSAGFTDATLLNPDEFMNAVVKTCKE